MAPSPRDLLLHGELAVQGRMPWSSNATFLAEACLDNHTLAAVYKPLRGERPLWDFPGGLPRCVTIGIALPPRCS
jgi:hypothetical protein